MELLKFNKNLSNTGPGDLTNGLLRLINISFAFYLAAMSAFMIDGSKCFSAKFHVEIHNSSFAYATYKISFMWETFREMESSSSTTVMVTVLPIE